MPDGQRLRVRYVPSRRLLAVLLGLAVMALALLVAGAGVSVVAVASAASAAALGAVCVYDLRASIARWKTSAPVMSRRLPSAFALSVQRPVTLVFDNAGQEPWACEVFDHADPALATDGLPMSVEIPAGARVETTYTVTPTRRGDVTFAPADVRVRSGLGCFDVLATAGAVEHRRVFPDFSQVSRYAWLAGSRRLQEIGIKSIQQRGEGTDFKQLSEYRQGDSIRHIDWRATLRLGQPIVRQFQDERDQNVILLVDCGRRMRAADPQANRGGGHFDQVLNAVMLLTYVALKQGDAVGALTCGLGEARERSVPARKGPHALSMLMSELYDVQPTLGHVDYVASAQRVLRDHPKRSLVVLITNFRDEDTTELQLALTLLRSRHLVLVSSVRERIIDEMRSRPLRTDEDAIAVASAHLYAQARRDSFNRLAARDALMVDAVPERLGVELVNRYHAAKRAGLL